MQRGCLAIKGPNPLRSVVILTLCIAVLRCLSLTAELQLYKLHSALVHNSTLQRRLTKYVLTPAHTRCYGLQHLAAWCCTITLKCTPCTPRHTCQLLLHAVQYPPWMGPERVMLNTGVADLTMCTKLTATCNNTNTDTHTVGTALRPEALGWQRRLLNAANSTQWQIDDALVISHRRGRRTWCRQHR